MALHFELVSPAKLLFSGEVESVVVPGADGFMTIYGNHAPVLTTLRPGVLVFTTSKGEEKMFVRGGFAEVNAKGLTVLAERATPAAEMNPATHAAHIKEAEEALEKIPVDDFEPRRVAQENLDHLKGMAV